MYKIENLKQEINLLLSSQNQMYNFLSVDFEKREIAP